MVAFAFGDLVDEPDFLFGWQVMEGKEELIEIQISELKEKLGIIIAKASIGGQSYVIKSGKVILCVLKPFKGLSESGQYVHTGLVE